MPGDSAADAVRARSGPNHCRPVFCATPGCPENGKEKIIWAIKLGNGILSIPRLWCPGCLREPVMGPWRT